MSPFSVVKQRFGTKWQRFCVALYMGLIATCGRVFAQQTTMTACSQSNMTFGNVQANGGAPNIFEQLANFVMAGPVKYGIIAAIGAIVLTLVFDNGQLGQIVQRVLMVIAAVLLVTLVISWVLAQNFCVQG